MLSPCGTTTSGGRSTPWRPSTACPRPASRAARASTPPPSTPPSASAAMGAPAGPPRKAWPRCSPRPAPASTPSRRWSLARPRPAARRRCCRPRRPAEARRIPLIGFAQAGADGYFDDGGYPVGGGWDEIAVPEVGDQNAYALEISGESMEPVFRDGDMVIVSPAAPVRRGDRVVVRTAKGRGDGEGAEAAVGEADRPAQPQSGASRLRLRLGGDRLDAPHRLGEPVGTDRPQPAAPRRTLLPLGQGGCRRRVRPRCDLAHTAIPPLSFPLIVAGA